MTVKEGETQERIKELLHRHRIEKVVVIDDDYQLKGLITVNDFSKAKITRMPPKTVKVTCWLVRQLVLVPIPSAC